MDVVIPDTGVQEIVLDDPDVLPGVRLSVAGWLQAGGWKWQSSARPLLQTCQLSLPTFLIARNLPDTLCAVREDSAEDQSDGKLRLLR